MALTEDERKEAISELEASFKSYLESEKARLENERDWLKNVLAGRTGGVQDLQLLNVEEAAIFATDEINDLIGGA